MEWNAEKYNPWIKYPLLAFVFLAIGFAAGKHVALYKFQQQRAASSPEEQVKKTGPRVIVYYMHATVRCDMCTTIERMTHELLKKKYAKQLESGVIQWASVDFQTNEALAKKYDVAASGVFLVKEPQNGQVEFKNLLDVWDLYETPTEFDAYVEKELNTYLAEIAEK